MFPFRDQLRASLPRWLAGALGTDKWALVSALGQELDRCAYFAKRAWESWLATNAPVDRLTSLGRERRLPRYASDTDATYRQRLWGAWDFYSYLGTSKAITDTIALLGYRAEVVCEKDWGPGDKPDTAEMWNRFWVRVWGVQADSWDNPDDTWDNPDDTWNCQFDLQTVIDLRDIVIRCRACHNLFVGFIFEQEDGRSVFLNLNVE